MMVTIVAGIGTGMNNIVFLCWYDNKLAGDNRFFTGGIPPNDGDIPLLFCAAATF